MEIYELLNIIGFNSERDFIPDFCSYNDYTIEVSYNFKMMIKTSMYDISYTLKKHNKFLYNFDELYLTKFLKEEFKHELRKYKINKLINENS